METNIIAFDFVKKEVLSRTRYEGPAEGLLRQMEKMQEGWCEGESPEHKVFPAPPNSLASKEGKWILVVASDSDFGHYAKISKEDAETITGKKK